MKISVKLKLRINIDDRGTSFRTKLIELLSLYKYNFRKGGKFRTLD